MHKVIIQPRALEQFNFPQDAIIITDRTVAKLFPKLLGKYHHIILPAGEKVKHLATVETICAQLIKLGCYRGSTLVGLGGGVVTDITGFVASIFMRGIQYYSVPTTLLAMVDASIGGKTGIDLASGKNLVGTFYPPAAVIIDPTVLATLPPKQFAQGMAEVIKHGVIDKDLFEWLERHKSKIQQRDIKTLQTLIKKNVDLKLAIVETDPTENEVRMLLNLGHTFAHAFELLSRYTLPHGEAVAIGLVYAAKFAHMPELVRLLALLNYFNLPTKLAKSYPVNQVIKVMQADKKRRNKNLTLVLPEQIGSVTIHYDITARQLERFLKTR